MKTPAITLALILLLTASLKADALDASAIGQAAQARTFVESDGVVRVGWRREDVKVTVDGTPFPPAAGLGSWAAFKKTNRGAMVMGDTVVFQDEVDAAMDAAFANNLEVTALHNHFFHDEPKVYFMHIGGYGEPEKLAGAVREVWDAIKRVRQADPEPATSFEGPKPTPGGEIDVMPVETIIGLEASKEAGGVIKVTQGREGKMHGVTVGGTTGLSTWAAFVGSNELASIDGDFIMTANEVQPVLRALRDSGIHIVALHNHMIGEEPQFYFVHFWGTGPVGELAKGFKKALDAQASHAKDDESHD